MSGQLAGRETAGSRWLLFRLGEKQCALRLSGLVRVLDQAELFLAPKLPGEFKGVIYFNEQAVPVVNWEAFGIKPGSGRLLLIVEQGKDRVGLEVEETGKVGEYNLGPGVKEKGFWVELEPERGIWGLDQDKFFSALKQEH